VLYAVGLGGFLVRLGVIVAVIALLQQTEWFSIVAFIAALIPSTIALLVVEMKLLSGRMQADLWAEANARREVAR
jgi:cytochrome c biogenesis factor